MAAHDHGAMMNMATNTTMNHMMMHTTTAAMHDMGGMDMMDHSQHNHGVSMDMGNDTDRTCAGHMLMFFHTGKCEYVLFETLRTKDVGGLVGACIAVFVLAMLYEGLKVVREMLLQKSMLQNSKYAVSSNGTSSQDTMVISHKNIGIHMMSCSHFIQTVLHMIQVFISYCLMLVFMTYNVWLCLSVILGAGIGYFLFGWRKAIVVDINEHCH